MVHASQIRTPKRSNPVFQSINEFRKIREIGEGAYSKVYEMEHIPTRVRYAVKDIPLVEIQEEDIGNIESEILVHPQMRHDNIIKMVDFFFTETTLYIFVE